MTLCFLDCVAVSCPTRFVVLTCNSMPTCSPAELLLLLLPAPPHCVSAGPARLWPHRRRRHLRPPRRGQAGWVPALLHKHCKLLVFYSCLPACQVSLLVGLAAATPAWTRAAAAAAAAAPAAVPFPLAHLAFLPKIFPAFTGSTEIGKMIMAAGAKRVVPVTLELGGKSPLIVSCSLTQVLHAWLWVWFAQGASAGCQLAGSWAACHC